VQTLDQPTLRVPSGALGVGLAGLRRDDVGQRHPQLEHLIAGDHPLARGDSCAQAVEQ